MHVISKKKLIDFWISHPDAEQSLKAWYAEARNSNWKTPVDVKKRYHTADVLFNNRVIFNIKGNKYRMVVKINYFSRTVFIRFVGTHAEYDRIDAETI